MLPVALLEGQLAKHLEASGELKQLQEGNNQHFSSSFSSLDKEHEFSAKCQTEAHLKRIC